MENLMAARVISVIFIAISSMSCMDSGSALSTEDRNWIAPFDPIDYAHVLNKKDEITTFEVVDNSAVDKAIGRLHSAYLIEISRNEVSEFSSSFGKTAATSPTVSSLYFLIRSCYFNNRDRNTLYFNGNVLLHTSSNFGEKETVMQKSALVVSLNQEPNRYRFYCSLAK